MRGAVYAITAIPHGGPVKIGWTARSGEARRRELQRATSTPLDLLMETPGTREEEQAILAHFRPYRIRGEWFRPEQALMDWIQATAEGVSLQAYLGGLVDLDTSPKGAT